MGLMAVKPDFRGAAIALVVIASETPTARALHIDGNLIDVPSCHHADFPLMIDTMALDASLNRPETGGDGTTMPDDRCLVKVGNGGAGGSLGGVSTACALLVRSLSCYPVSVGTHEAFIYGFMSASLSCNLHRSVS